MHAIILAGGLGTRLREAVPDVPKPMAPIGGRPFLHYLLLQLRGHGLRDVLLCLGYRAEAIEQHFGSGAALGMRLSYSIEPEPLGTGGALKLAQPLLSGSDWLILNGDSYFGIDLAALIDAHRASAPLATLALCRMADAARYGSVELDQAGHVRSFVEKRASAGAPAADALINAGVYMVARELLDVIPSIGPVSLERDVFPPLVGPALRGVVFDGDFIDIGLPADYARLSGEWPSLFGGLVTE